MITEQELARLPVSRCDDCGKLTGSGHRCNTEKIEKRPNTEEREALRENDTRPDGAGVAAPIGGRSGSRSKAYHWMNCPINKDGYTETPRREAKARWYYPCQTCVKFEEKHRRCDCGNEFTHAIIDGKHQAWCQVCEIIVQEPLEDDLE